MDAQICNKKGGKWDKKEKICVVQKIDQNVINKFINIKDDIAINLIDADDRSKDRVLLEMEWLLEEMEK